MVRKPIKNIPNPHNPKISLAIITAHLKGIRLIGMKETQ
jgi:hypothetical protein